MTNEITEMWRDNRKAKQKKRSNNREHSIRILKTNNVKFESKNMGAHLIVDTKMDKIDFWPGTGLWIERTNGKKDRGIRRLLRWIQDLPSINLVKDPDTTLIQTDFAETEARLIAHIEQENKHDPNTTRTGADHPTQPDDGKVGNKLPWD